MSEPITPIVQTGRNRRNVVTGAPDVRLSGGFWIGPEALNPDLFPKGAREDAKEIAERLKLASGGYVSQDGVSEAEDRSVDKLKDWNLDVIDTVETDYGLQWTVTFVEAANAEVLKFIYGSENVKINKTSDAEGEEYVEVYVRKGARQNENASIMFDIKGKGNAFGRTFGASVSVASIGEIQYIKGGLIQYQTTIDAFTDVTGTSAHTWMGQRGAPESPAPASQPGGGAGGE